MRGRNVVGDWERAGLCYLYTKARRRSAARYLHVDRVFQAMWFLRLGHCMRLLREDQFGDVPRLTSPRAGACTVPPKQQRAPQFAGQRAVQLYTTVTTLPAMRACRCPDTRLFLMPAMLWSCDSPARQAETACHFSGPLLRDL